MNTFSETGSLGMAWHGMALIKIQSSVASMFTKLLDELKKRKVPIFKMHFYFSLQETKADKYDRASGKEWEAVYKETSGFLKKICTIQKNFHTKHATYNKNQYIYLSSLKVYLLYRCNIFFKK